MTYSPKNWYWFVAGDRTQVFSSARNSFVPAADATYQAWLAASAPSAPTGIDTLDNLKAVLADAGVPPHAPVTNIQARLALRQSGLIAAANTAVAASTADVQDMWEYSAMIHRDNPQLLTLAAALNLNGTQLDSLFTLAASL